MARPISIISCLCIFVSIIIITSYDDLGARGKSVPDLRRVVATYRPPVRSAPAGVFRAPAGADTTELGFWDFEGMSGGDPQGWISADRTAQAGDFFHVDDFAGLGGGDFGRLYPLQGAQSLWCGVRPDNPLEALCGYATLPGYGNDWIQHFSMAECESFSGDATVDFLVAWDTEPLYDFVYVDWEKCDAFPWEYWRNIAEYDGVGSGFLSHTVATADHGGSMRFRIRFESDAAWSDADGEYNSDGAVIIDSLTVRDTLGVVLPTELFETESVGDTESASGNWINRNIPYGDFAGLFPGTEVVQWRDECTSNLTHLWGFFNGSTYDYACEGFPLQKVVPYRNDRDQYIDNQVWSPWIDMPTSGGSQIEFSCDWYRDNVLDELVFGTWRVRSRVDGCAQPWTGPEYWLYYGTSGWSQFHDALGPYIDPAASQFQVALGVYDACKIWCGIYAYTPVCHSNAPLFDNVRVYQLEVTSPQWVLEDRHMFQDDFAGDGTLTGTARADMAMDLLSLSQPNIIPGDSVVVTVTDLDNGLAGDPYTGNGSAVYCYVSVRPQGQPGKSGAALTDDPSRWPVVDSLTHDGAAWYMVRMDTVQGTDPELTDHRFCVDLNDNLFTPGDTVFFVFAAKSGSPLNTFSYGTLGLTESGTGSYETDDLSTALAYADEFTVLPTVGGTLEGGILYVDGVNGSGTQPFYDDVFRVIGVGYRVDRFDIRSPQSNEGNHPGARVRDVSRQLSSRYRFIVWSAGPLEDTFGNGEYPFKSDDAAMLEAFLGGLDASGGVYMNGDNVADYIPVYLRNSYVEFNVTDWDHEPVVGVSPLVVGEPGSIFTDEAHGRPDSLVAEGGCPWLSKFDIFTAAGACTVQASYHGSGNTRGAVVMQHTPVAPEVSAGFVLSGFSFEQIRDLSPGDNAAPDHMLKILKALGIGFSTPAPVPDRGVNSLAQNYPNPFNPTTTIEYSIARPGHVTLRVYNVAGQLVRTLVDEVQTPGLARSVRWDGRNGTGQAVSSGVYFYKLSTEGFTKTRKMVMLK